MRVFCPDCQKISDFTLDAWRCPCGDAWEVAEIPTFEDLKINSNDYSIWRYGQLLGLDVHSPIQKMGIGWTPLVHADLFARQVNLKLEYLSPSGSFKDRGVNAMFNQLVYMGAQGVIEDSSGNAGASVAAHAARFGINAEIFVPAYASPAKQEQIRVYGANVIQIQGSRKAVEEAAQAAIGPGKPYASHAYNPAYLVGQMTVAYELWEQLNRIAPDWVICPVAQGGAFLGMWFGFRQLMKAGLIQKLPHLVAVQAANVAPIYQAWIKGLDHIPFIENPKPTVAEGVAITRPVRQKRILQALYETDGKVLAVPEERILQAQETITQKGFYIEPTSALAVAGLSSLKDVIPPEDTVVLILTGSGLKGLPQL